MGMYTEIFVNVDLRKDTPQEIVETLKAMCAKESEHPLLANHPYRWGYLFNSGSYYTPNTECGNLTWDDIGKNWSLLAKGDIKNYESEIEAFFEWIMPYVDAEPGEFIGYSRHEESMEPELRFFRG